MRFRVGVRTSYLDDVEVEADSWAEALAEAKRLNEAGEVPERLGGTEVEYLDLEVVEEES